MKKTGALLLVTAALVCASIAGGCTKKSGEKGEGGTAAKQPVAVGEKGATPGQHRRGRNGSTGQTYGSGGRIGKSRVGPGSGAIDPLRT